MERSVVGCCWLTRTRGRRWLVDDFGGVKKKTNNASGKGISRAASQQTSVSNTPAVSGTDHHHIPRGGDWRETHPAPPLASPTEQLAGAGPTAARVKLECFSVGMNLEVSLFADGTHKLKVSVRRIRSRESGAYKSGRPTEDSDDLLEMIALYLHIGDRATLCHVLYLPDTCVHTIIEQLWPIGDSSNSHRTESLMIYFPAYECISESGIYCNTRRMALSCPRKLKHLSAASWSRFT